jgi:hypothetical protein
LCKLSETREPKALRETRRKSVKRRTPPRSPKCVDIRKRFFLSRGEGIRWEFLAPNPSEPPPRLSSSLFKMKNRRVAQRKHYWPPHSSEHHITFPLITIEEGYDFYGSSLLQPNFPLALPPPRNVARSEEEKCKQQT